jgi:hypothetical protein
MSKELAYFRERYVDVLTLLYPHRNAGIVIFKTALPLLERYLRQKNGLRPDQDVDDRCMRTLVGLFPALPDKRTAWDFWRVYRNGFLHQATLSLKTGKGRSLPAGSLTHDIASAIHIEADGSFVVHPELFSKQVIQAIEGDFAVFAGAGTPAPQLLQVVAIVSPATGGIDVPPVILSTRS